MGFYAPIPMAADEVKRERETRKERRVRALLARGRRSPAPKRSVRPVEQAHRA